MKDEFGLTFAVKWDRKDYRTVMLAERKNLFSAY
jgi:hypothetical protein